MLVKMINMHKKTKIHIDESRRRPCPTSTSRQCFTSIAGSPLKNQAAKSPKNRITTYALNLMSRVFDLLGSKHCPFDQPDGVLDSRLSD